MFELVNIPESVSVIGEEAFSGTEITSITIPRLVISIGARAFEYTNITSIQIPCKAIEKHNEEDVLRCKFRISDFNKIFPNAMTFDGFDRISSKVSTSIRQRR